MAQKSIVYIVGGTPFEGGFIKYAGTEYQQFQASYREIVARFKQEGINVYFSRIQDITPDGTFQNICALSDEVGNDGALLLIPSSQVRGFTPNIVINRLKDDLYNQPLYEALVNKGVMILNPREVAQLGDKIQSLTKLSSYLPATRVLDESKTEYRRQVLHDFIDTYGKVVIKPHRSNGGLGISIVDSVNDSEVSRIVGNSEKYILQQYLETSEGVKGFIQGRHDVRLYAIGGNIIAGLTRQPKVGSLLSNTSLGGSFTLHTLSEIPQDLIDFASDIIQKLQLPKLSFISLDFFYSNRRWYLIEANDQPGLPALYQHKEVSSSIQNALVITCKEAIV